MQTAREVSEGQLGSSFAEDEGICTPARPPPCLHWEMQEMDCFCDKKGQRLWILISGLLSYRNKYCGIAPACSLRDFSVLNKHMSSPNSNKTNTCTRGKYLGLMCEYTGLERLQLFFSFLLLILIYRLSLAQIYKSKQRKCLQTIYGMPGTVLKVMWHRCPPPNPDFSPVYFISPTDDWGFAA